MLLSFGDRTADSVDEEVVSQTQLEVLLPVNSEKEGKSKTDAREESARTRLKLAYRKVETSSVWRRCLCGKDLRAKVASRLFFFADAGKGDRR